MANVLVTPEWITREFLRDYNELSRFQIGETIEIKLPQRYLHKLPTSDTPINGKVLLALGAAAVIANPQPITRRSMLGLGWWKRHGS